ncbi:MAG TPA: hypothetical protein VH598_12030 [Verrucomicrobiae bacterium]|nr:hypothetical protein [Verrucomicrobiae bacterium]
MNDLFGQPILECRPPRLRPNGYPRPPGSGPAGETCWTCDNYRTVHYHNKTYPKCVLIKFRWTHGPGTDIKAKSPACELWQPETNE